MENQVYEIENKSKEIKLTVTVTTPGIATTEVKLFLSDGSIINKGHSTNGAGLISEVSIGIDTILNNSTIKIETYVQLSKIPKSAWESCYNNLQIHFYLNGGKGNQVISFELLPNEKNKSSNGELISGIKRIDLINI
ncbi:MAG: hypothetical protein ABI549_11575 [Flavobacterium sp.]|uniref:hypothetical protein n=1 Tax=Flavobacterium sp. TaxID=239 RepID=UPI003266675C